MGLLFQILVFCMILRGHFGYTGYMLFRYTGIPLTPWPTLFYELQHRFQHSHLEGKNSNVRGEMCVDSIQRDLFSFPF